MNRSVRRILSRVRARLAGDALRSASLLFVGCSCTVESAAQPPATPSVSSAPLATSPALRWQFTDASLAVEVDGLSSDQIAEFSTPRSDQEWAQLFSVHVEPSGAQENLSASPPLPPTAGSWRVSDGRLRFELRFPPGRDVQYRARLNLPRQAAVISSFQPPSRSTVPTTTVSQVFPSAEVLPENQLKFYVQFSAPMSRGDVYRHVHIRDAQGHKIDLPFLELDEELWDPPMTRLTLLIDPGRIKRGVKPLEDTGPVFEAGKSYMFVIDAACRDAEGRTLRADFEKKFQIGPPDRTAPDPTRWKITPPAAGGLGPLVVAFNEPMEHALALRLIGVVFSPSSSQTAGAKTSKPLPIEGAPTLSAAESQWHFNPSQPWKRGSYRLVVAPTIEDLAGNNIGKTFDVDLAGGASPHMPDHHIEVSFDVK